MSWIKRVRRPQPETKKKVVELEIAGPIGRWFTKHNWGAFTYPLPFLVLIFYWAASTAEDPNPYVRVHEFVHVKQDEGNAFFLVSWVKYVWAMGKAFYWHGVRNLGEALMDAYRGNEYEVAAYFVEDDAERNGLPDWAK